MEPESLSDRHLIVPIETIFTATPSFYPRNDCQIADFEYAFAVLKPHSIPSKSQEMLGNLCEQGRNKGLDMVGCRIAHVEAGWREVYGERFTKVLGGAESVLVLCWYGYNAIEKLHEILGAETPELAKRTDPESVRALYGESKERNCAYTAKVKQRVYKEICVWFGGRVDPATPSITLLECPKVENAFLALSPQTNFKSLMRNVEKLLQFGFCLTNVARLSAESTSHCGFLPTTLTVLKTQLKAQYGWLISLKRPAARSHLATAMETGLNGRVMNEEEVAFLQGVSGEYGDIETLAAVGYIMATAEAFIQTADSFPVSKIGETIADHCEILSLKLVCGPLPSEIEADYSDTVAQTISKSQYSTDKVKLKFWLEAGPNLLFAYLPDSPEASKRLISALKKTISNQGFSDYMKPSYLLVPRSGKALLLPSEMVLDPHYPGTALLYLPAALQADSSALDQDLTTVCVIKPDKSLMLFRQVLKFISRHEFRITQAHMHQLTPSLIDLLYSNQAEAMDSALDYSSFTATLQAGPCISLKLTRHHNAIKKLREIIGHPDPHLAEINTLRGSYGKSAEDNKLHCSLSYAHAKTEALRLFSGDEFVPCEVEETMEIEEMACAVGILGDSLVRILEEMKGMQLSLVDFRVSVLSESLLESYMLAFPENNAFAQAVYQRECVALLVKGLSPAYRLTSLLQTLGVLTTFHLSTSAPSLHSLSSLFFPPHPY
jgi:nucleoside diphosphate kinase